MVLLLSYSIVRTCQHLLIIRVQSTGAEEAYSLSTSFHRTAVKWAIKFTSADWISHFANILHWLRQATKFYELTFTIYRPLVINRTIYSLGVVDLECCKMKYLWNSTFTVNEKKMLFSNLLNDVFCSFLRYTNKVTCIIYYILYYILQLHACLVLVQCKNIFCHRTANIRT